MDAALRHGDPIAKAWRTTGRETGGGRNGARWLVQGGTAANTVCRPTPGFRTAVLSPLLGLRSNERELHLSSHTGLMQGTDR